MQSQERIQHMDKEILLRKAARLGFQDEATAGPNEANQTLAEVVKSLEPSLWEAFPVMLLNAAEAGEFSYEAANACLEEEERKYLKLLIMMSLGLYDSLGLTFPWREQLFGKLPARLISNFGKKLKSGTALELGNVTLQAKKLTSSLAGYKPKTGISPMSGEKSREESALEAALKQIFTERQKGLLFKRLNQEKLTKTETEYFSRVIRKKILALANEDLHRLARRALE